MLYDLIGNLRKNEPKSILIFRRSAIVILITLTIVAFVTLCIGIRDEIPSIKTTWSEAKSLPVPGKNTCFEQEKKKIPNSNIVFSNI